VLAGVPFPIELPRNGSEEARNAFRRGNREGGEERRGSGLFNGQIEHFTDNREEDVVALGVELVAFSESGELNSIQILFQGLGRDGMDGIELLGVDGVHYRKDGSENVRTLGGADHLFHLLLEDVEGEREDVWHEVHALLEGTVNEQLFVRHFGAFQDGREER
jgi:hypothetical protein